MEAATQVRVETKAAKKRDVDDESLGHWDRLPEEIQAYVLILSVRAADNKKKDKGWCAINRELPTLSKCQIYDTVSNLVCFEKIP